jgi:hypothetical protein
MKDGARGDHARQVHFMVKTRTLQLKNVFQTIKNHSRIGFLEWCDLMKFKV